MHAATPLRSPFPSSFAAGRRPSEKSTGSTSPVLTAGGSVDATVTSSPLPRLSSSSSPPRRAPGGHAGEPLRLSLSVCARMHACSTGGGRRPRGRRSGIQRIPLNPPVPAVARARGMAGGPNPSRPARLATGLACWPLFFFYFCFSRITTLWFDPFQKSKCPNFGKPKFGAVDLQNLNHLLFAELDLSEYF